MKCMKCGTENPDTAKFCRKCGNKMEIFGQEGDFFKDTNKKSDFNDTTTKKNGKYDNKTKIQIGAGAVVALLVLIYLFKPHPLVVNLEDYVSIEYSGYDSRGSVSVIFDDTSFREKYMKKNKANGREVLSTHMGNGSEDSYYDNIYIDEMPPYVEAYVTPGGNLSNGDKVEVRFEYDNKSAAKVKLKYKGDKITSKVKGLEEVPVIDLKEYCSVNFSGVDTRGTAELNIDEEALNNHTYGLTDYFTCQVAPQENLTNGDTVTVSFSVDEEEALNNAKIALEAEDFTVEVKDLKEIETIDPFEDVEVSFRGTAPFVEVAEITQKEGINFEIDKNCDLDIGDQVTVSVSEDTKERFYQEGCEPAMTEKVYTVTDVGAYIRDPETISKDGLNYMKSEAEDRIEAYYGKNAERYEIKNQEFCGTSVVYLKAHENYRYNRVILLYRIEEFNKEKEEIYVRYYPFRFNDYIQNSDGSVYGGEIDIDWDETYDTIQDFQMRYLAPYKSEYKVVMSAELSEWMAK